jgi:phosphatidylinositol 4-kinase
MKIKSLSEDESDENSEVNNNDQYILKCDELNKINSYIEIIFGEKIEDQTERLRKNSPYGFLNTFKLMKIIVKSGEDLRQEQFATQLINEFYQIFKLEKVDCWVNTYEILATGNNVGIIEVVPNSISLDQLKRKTKHITSLKKFYDVCFSPINSDKYKKALKNFISSLAGYSLVCYFLQIKDRHNANILIDDEGHIIHIDFGYMLSNAPGKGLQFEKAPFKLTKEFVDVMGGLNSKYFTKFRKLLWK